MNKPIINIKTKRLIIRSVSAEDRHEYMSLRIEGSDMAFLYEANSDFAEAEWERELDSPDSVYVSVFLAESMDFVGSGSIQNFDSDSIELGVDVKKEFRRKGIATEIISALLYESHRLFPNAEVRMKMSIDNEASRKVAEKCGGKYEGKEDTEFAKIMAKLKAELDAEGISLEGKDQIERDKAIEEGHDGICCYRLP